MKKEMALEIVNRYNKGIACPLGEPEYVGELYDEQVFYCPRKNKGKHLGWPIYYSVSNIGKVKRLLPPLLMEAIDLRTNNVQTS